MYLIIALGRFGNMNSNNSCQKHMASVNVFREEQKISPKWSSLERSKWLARFPFQVCWTWYSLNYYSATNFQQNVLRGLPLPTCTKTSNYFECARLHSRWSVRHNVCHQRIIQAENGAQTINFPFAVKAFASTLSANKFNFGIGCGKIKISGGSAFFA